MKIGLAQTQSSKGEVQKNIQNHLRIIERAIESNVDLILFPELSITGYEPELAKGLACESNDSIFHPFQELADKNNIIIGIGMPLKAIDGVNISMLIFQPFKERLVYSKSILHDDELPYFLSGKSQPILEVQGKKIALGICYETLQRGHFVKAVESDADIYIASVAKPDRGVSKAHIHFPFMAKEFNIPVLMVNSVGYCDNFLSNGTSSIWNEKGELMEHLDSKNQGLLIYNTELNATETVVLKI